MSPHSHPGLDIPEHDGKAYKTAPISMTVPIGFASLLIAAVSMSNWHWPLRWILSGTAPLTLFILLGAAYGYRILPFIPLWTLLATLNLGYSIAATSWLLYGVNIVVMYPATFLTCLFQFDLVARQVRRVLRKVLKELQFTQDIVSFFDIPALEIDVDVDGLMVVRGLTVSLSRLTIIAHGIEVGIKLSGDMELALSTERVSISLFRRIEISDVYANIKGGLHEMTFGELEEVGERDADGDALMVEATPLLQAAAARGDKSKRPRMVKMKSQMTAGRDRDMADSKARDGWRSMRTIKMDPEDKSAGDKYRETLKWIWETNTIQVCRAEVEKGLAAGRGDAGSIKGKNSPPASPSSTRGASATAAADTATEKDTRAAICSAMQSHPSVPHPPRRSVKITTLQSLSNPRTRRLMHRMPLLLRLLLNPLSYFHPVTISSVTAGGSGTWIAHLLQAHLFKTYAEENRELRKLEKRILAWLADANFVLQLADFEGVASVPVLTAYDILARIKIGDVLAYRTPAPVSAPLDGGSGSGDGAEDATDDKLGKGKGQSAGMAERVVRLGGADATFTIPSFLLPHHEHLLPPVPSAEDKASLADDVAAADGQPQAVQAEHALSQAEADEANVGISAHVQLPAVFSQELLTFVAALVKATKVVEMEKEPGAMEAKLSGIKEFAGALSRGMKEGMKKTVVDGIISDRWIAKMVGKVTRKLENAQGDVGYSGDIPVKLAKYRLPEGHPELNKILV